MRGHKADRSWQKGKGKGGQGDWETGKGGSKGKGWQKGKWSHTCHAWDNSWHSSHWHGKTYGLDMDPWAAVEPVPYLCAVSLNSSEEEFSEPKRVSREKQIKILPSTKDFTHANRFLSLEKSENEFTWENCTSVHTSNAQCQKGGYERGDGCNANKGSSKQSAHQVSYLAVPSGDSKGVHLVGGSGWRRVSAIMDSGSAECVAPENIARNTPLMETEASRQGQTYHTADGGASRTKEIRL